MQTVKQPLQIYIYIYIGDNCNYLKLSLLANPYFVLPKGFFDQKTATDMLKESEKMQDFQHPHVLNIIGVCVDAGPAPYIIMPFIANGSLLAYVKKEKTNLVVPKDADDELVS